MKKYITLLFTLMLILAMSDTLYASKRPRRKKTSKSTTKSAKNKSKKSKSIKSSSDSIQFIISKSDSLLAAGDSISVANAFYKFFESADTIDTTEAKLVLWSMEFLATHSKGADVLKTVDKIPQIDSTFAPNADYIRTLAYFSIGRNGYAYMLANRMINRYAGTDWEKKANNLANRIRGKLPNISLKQKSQKPDTTNQKPHATTQPKQSK